MDAQQLAARLMQQIQDGELRPGDRLPLTVELAEKYGVNKNTVSKAVQELKRTGILTGMTGGITRVRITPLHTKRDNLRYQAEKDDALLPESERSGSGISEATNGIPVGDLYQADTDSVITTAPADIAAILGLSDSGQVWRRVFTRRHAAGAGASRSTSYIPYDLVKDHPEMMDPAREPYPGGTIAQLRELGVEVDKIVDHVTTSMPTPEEVQDYDIPPGVPIMRILKISYSTEARAVEVAEIPIPGDRVELIYTTQLERWK